MDKAFLELGRKAKENVWNGKLLTQEQKKKAYFELLKKKGII